MANSWGTLQDQMLLTCDGLVSHLGGEGWGGGAILLTDAEG